MGSTVFTSFLCNSCNFQYFILGWPTLVLGPSIEAIPGSWPMGLKCVRDISAVQPHYTQELSCIHVKYILAAKITCNVSLAPRYETVLTHMHSLSPQAMFPGYRASLPSTLAYYCSYYRQKQSRPMTLTMQGLVGVSPL